MNHYKVISKIKNFTNRTTDMYGNSSPKLYSHGEIYWRIDTNGSGYYRYFTEVQAKLLKEYLDNKKLYFQDSIIAEATLEDNKIPLNYEEPYENMEVSPLDNQNIFGDFDIFCQTVLNIDASQIIGVILQ